MVRKRSESINRIIIKMRKSMLSFFVMLFKSLLGELLTKLLSNAASTIYKVVTDKEMTHMAYEFAKELSQQSDMDAKEKATEFNKLMLSWAKSVGKDLKDSTLNCIREFAVAVIKSEMEKHSS